MRVRLHRIHEHSLATASERRRRQGRGAFAWPGLESLEGRLFLSAVSWDGGGDGVNWTSANNWSNNTVPTSIDDVTIENAGAVTLSGSQSVNSLEIVGNQTLSLLNSTLTLGGGGSIISHLILTGTGTVNTTGELTISGSSSMSDSSVLAGPGTIFNTGTLNLTGGSNIQTELQVTGTMTADNSGLFGGAFYVRGAGAKVRVLNGGVFNLTNSSIQRPDGGLGVFIESGGTMNNIGSNATGNALTVDGGNVNVVGGNLIFNSGSSLHNATFNVASGANVYFNNNGPNAVSGTITGTGAGQIMINGSSSFDLASDGAVFNFAINQLLFQNAASINGPGTLTNVGYIYGTPVLKTKVLNTGIFAPTGTVTFTGTDAELRILAGGTFTSTGVGLAGDATSVGLIVESGGLLNGSINTGVIPVQILGGTIKTTTSTSVAFYGNTTLVGAILDTTGGGQIFFQGGSNTTFSGVITGIGAAGSAVFANGPATFNVATGGATLDFAPGMAVFYDATINGPGVLTCVGELLMAANNLILRTELRIENKLNLVGTNPSLTIDGPSGLLRIADGGLFYGSSNINGHSIVASNGGLGVVVDHGGTFQSTSTFIGLYVSAPFDNRGTVLSDGVLHFTGSVAQISGTTGNIALTGGTWIQHANTFLDFVGTSINTIGADADVTIGSGNFRFPALTGLSNNAGTLRLIEGQNLPATSQFTNSGTLTLSPGSALSIGTFTQTNTGVTEFQISGAGAGQQGQLIGTDAATLAGTARVTVTGGFNPAVGQNFPLMTFTSHTGSFTKIEGLNIGQANVFEAAYTATTFSLNSLVSAADLDVDTITLPGASTSGQNISFSYSVKNVSTFPTPIANWTDTIYLSKDGTLDANDILLTRVAHSGAVAANGTYTENVTVPLVGALPENYRIIVIADSRGFVADTDRTNNTLASTGTFAIDVPALTPGVVFNGSIQSGQDLYYRVSLPAGLTPTFTFTGTVTGQAEIYESLGLIPSTASFDQSAFTAGSSEQRVMGNATTAATYYILLHGRENAGAGQNFSLLASGTGFDIAATSVTHGANIGNVTTTLTGSQFTADTTFAIALPGGTPFNATAVYYRDSSTADATFDLTGLTPGSYNIIASSGILSDTLTSALTVTAGGHVGTLDYSLSAPRAVRPPFVGVAATLTYENVGDTDLQAPLFDLIAENARLRLADEGFVAGTFTQASGRELGVFELLGVSGGLAGVLSPGEKATINVIFEPIDATAHAMMNFNVTVAGNNSDPINFDSLKADVKPVGVADDAWNAVFTNFTNAAGTTVGSYHAMLVDNANYLGQFGNVSPSVTRLVDFELDQAGALGAIVNRYQLGAFGRGQASPMGQQLTANTSGDVTIKDGNIVRTFARMSDGTYVGTGVDFGLLTRSNAGVFTLNEGNGTSTIFRVSDGHIDYLENANGQRITAAWNGSGQLVSVTDSLTGNTTQYTYDGNGRIVTETDPVGRVTNYGYDAGGEHLTSVTNAQGLTTFTYVTGQGAASEHAVASSTGPDGVTTNYTYDALGRLTQRSTGSGPQAFTVSFAYDSAGKITQTDSASNVTQVYYVAQGAIARTIDPLGQITSVTYDALGRLVSATDPSGITSKVSLDSAGLLRGVVDASRNETSLSIGGDIRRLQSITDPGGDTTNLTYDAKGNLLQTLYPDNFAVHYEYDSSGRVIATTDANGARTAFTYNSVGLLTQRTYADGNTVDFTYDAHRNLISATNTQGVTTLAYDAADRLTSIAYPNGKTITNTYDSAGRRVSVADQTGFTVRYSYDALGRLSAVRDTANALLVNYDYNALGQITTETRGNGSTTAYTYDAAQRVITITHRDAANAITGFFNYTYDEQDRVKTVTDTTGLTTYTYDLTGQLIGAVLPGGRTISYGYDVEGNRVTVTDSSAGSENYTTNNADQYTTAGGETLTYDHAGRVVASSVGGVTTSYSYDVAGRLAGIVSPGSVITYEYDALGNRISKTENGLRTDLANDSAGLGSLFGEYLGEDAHAHYAIGLGIAARADSTGIEAYYHYDASGNTAMLSGAGGSSVASYTYLPFGKIATQTGSITQPFTFNGAVGVQDETGDLYSMHARTYDAALGRFTSRDPIGFGGGDANLYRFVNNDPINQSDPSGLNPVLGGFPSGGTTTLFRNGFQMRHPFLNAGKLGDVGLVLGGSAGGIPSTTTIINPVAQNFATGDEFVRIAQSTLNSVANPGTNLPAVYDAEFATQQLLGKTLPTALSKGAQVLNFLKPIAKFLSPVAKVLGSVPVQVTLGVISVAEIESAAFDYYRDAGTYGKFNPDEKNFSPDYYKKNGDNWLLNQLIKDGIAGGKSKQDATLSALAFIKKLNNDYLRDQQNQSNGAAGAAAKVTGATVEIVRPHDPNNIIGPSGAGADALPDTIAPGQTRFDGFVNGNANFPYKIEFENKDSASAPAQVVHVTQTLDANLDLTTFAFTSFGFGAFDITVPASANGTNFHTIVDATATLNVNVKIDATLDTQTGLLDVIYTSIDPATNDVPLDPFVGFLPPNDANGIGDGFLTYSVRPKSALTNGTNITAIASIVFDTEAAIATPTVTNRLDLLAPSSTLSALATTTSRTNFAVHWTGSDDIGGSGLSGFTLYYTDNDGVLQTAVANTSATGVLFTGQVGHTYKFFSQAVDNVGNTETLSLTPGDIVTVVAPTLVPITGSHNFTDADGDTYTVTLTGPGTLNAVLLDPDGNGKGSLDSLIASGTTKLSKIMVTVKKAAGGDGLVSIGDMTVTGDLGTFTASQSDLNVNGLNVSGYLGSATFRDLLRPDPILTNPTIHAGGSNAQSTTITLRRMDNGSVIQLGSAITSITAKQIGSGSIEAPFIKTISVTGDKKSNIIGDFAADMHLSGAGIKAPLNVTLGTITIAGTLLGGTWLIDAGNVGTISVGDMSTTWTGNFAGAIQSLTSKAGVSGHLTAQTLGSLTAKTDLHDAVFTLLKAPISGSKIKTNSLGTVTIGRAITNAQLLSNGNIGAVTTSSMINSVLYAGVTTVNNALPTTANQFIAEASIASLTIKGITGSPAADAFVNSNIAAATLTSVTLKNAHLNNNGTPFGIAAKTIKMLSLSQGTKKYTWPGKWILTPVDLTVRDL